MKHDNSTLSWNKIGQDWCDFSQQNDYRMNYIMPYTLEKLGNVNDKKVLDLGCGEGGYSRELAKMGAVVTSADCNAYFIRYAESAAKHEGLSIEHLVLNSNDLHEIDDSTYDIVLCSMMLMDCEDFQGTINEIHRVLKKDGYLFASVSHPWKKRNR